MRRESLGRAVVGCAHDHDQEECGQHDFRYEARQQGIAARRVLAVSVRSEPRMHVEAGRPAGDDVEHARSRNRSHNLRDHVRQIDPKQGSAFPPRVQRLRPD